MLLSRLVTYTVLFVLTNMDEGSNPTIDWLAKMIAFGFQDAVGQNFGWLKEIAK